MQKRNTPLRGSARTRDMSNRLLILLTLLASASSDAAPTRPSRVDAGAEVHLFIFRSGARLNFDTPLSLLLSSAKTYIHKYFFNALPGSMEFRPRAIGHVALSYKADQCAGWPSELPRERLTGQVGNRQQQGLQLALRGGGLAPMLAVFQDGELETPEVLLGDLKKHADHPGTSRVLRMRVSCAKARKLAHFVQQWDRSGAYRNYTLTLMPETFNPDRKHPDYTKTLEAGGGCGSFVMGALLYSDVLGEFGSALRKTVTLPVEVDLAMVHKPSKMPEFTAFRPEWDAEIARTEEKPIYKLFFDPGMRAWSKTGAARKVRIEATEPELFYDWLNGAATAVLQREHLPVWPERSAFSMSWWSAGPLSENLSKIASTKTIGSNWIEPYLKQGKAKVFASQESPYFGTPALEIDLREEP